MTPNSSHDYARRTGSAGTPGEVLIEYERNGTVFETDTISFTDAEFDYIQAFQHGYQGDSSYIKGEVLDLSINSSSVDFTTLSKTDPDNAISNITAGDFNFNVSDTDGDTSFDKSETGNVQTVKMDVRIDESNGYAGGFSIGVTNQSLGKRIAYTGIAWDASDDRLDVKPYSDETNGFLSTDFSSGDLPVTLTIRFNF